MSHFKRRFLDDRYSPPSSQSSYGIRFLTSECRWLCWWPPCWAKSVPSMRTKRRGVLVTSLLFFGGGPKNVKPIIYQWNGIFMYFCINSSWWYGPYHFVYIWTPILLFCCGPPVNSSTSPRLVHRWSKLGRVLQVRWPLRKPAIYSSLKTNGWRAPKWWALEKGTPLKNGNFWYLYVRWLAPENRWLVQMILSFWGV